MFAYKNTLACKNKIGCKTSAHDAGGLNRCRRVSDCWLTCVCDDLITVDKVHRFMSLWMHPYRIVVIGCDSLSWEHKVSVYAVQLSFGKLITRRLQDRDGNVATTMFLIHKYEIYHRYRLRCNMVSIRTKDLSQYITSVFAFLTQQ